MNRKYYITINSFYIKIDRVRFTGPTYIKADISYYSKGSDTFFAKEKGVKLYKNVMKHWEIYDL